VVAIDPATTSGENADETGIVVAGRCGLGRVYILADLSGRHAPDVWARTAAEAYRHWQADRIVAEVNQGGEMVKATLKVIDPMLVVKTVHASRGKVIRAEPVAALYAEGKVSHVGVFAALEDQMSHFTPEQNRKSGSPDRVDALVWALTDLMLDDGTTGLLDYYRSKNRRPLA
jgi:phage terminase large subunit-like protein